jgi:hypothetical protein
MDVLVGRAVIAVKAGERVVVPIEISELPPGTLAFETVIECDTRILELTALDPDAGMVQGHASTFHNSPNVYEWWNAYAISKDWRTDHSLGRVGVNCADVAPLQGSLMFNLVGTAKKDGKVVVTCTFLTLGAEVLFGQKPSMYHLVEGTWQLYEG